MRYSLLLALFLSLFSRAQILDTSGTHRYKPTEVYRYSEYGLKFMEVDSQRLDTQLYGFYNYYKVYDQSFPMLDLGFEGSPVLKLSGTIQPVIGVNLGMDALSQYFKSDTLYSYLTPYPLTRLNYSQGKKELISIEAQHVQEISKRLTFGVDYNRLKNQNIYYAGISNPNQRFANLFNSKFHIGYFSFDRRYELLFTYRWAKNINLEPGGLKDPEFFNQLSGRNKEGNNPNYLSSAFNESAINDFSIVQYYRLGGQLDSNRPHDLSKFRSQLAWKTKYYNHRLVYFDGNADSAYYGHDYSEIEDSLHHLQVLNEISILLKLSNLKLVVGAEHRFDKVYQNGFAESFNTTYLLANAKFAYKGMAVNADWRMSLTGYNLGDYILRANGSLTYGSVAIQAGIISSLTEPFYLTQRLVSTVRNWDLNLDKTAINSIHGKAGIHHGLHSVQLRVDASNYTNLVYFKSDSIPSQFSGNIQHLQTQVKYHFGWRPLSALVEITNQQISNADVLPRPQWSSTAALYTQAKLFKKKLNVQIGLRGFWYSDFNAPVYNAYLRKWVNTDSLFKGYPPVEAFVNAKVLGFNFGVSFFNIQEGFMGNDFYASPGYPMLPRLLRINIRWDLRN